MKEWYDLLIEKDKDVSENTLLQILKHKIIFNDKSENVNMFTLKGVDYWFDKNTRASLINVANYVDDQIEFILGDKSIILNKEQALKFLYDLEIYSQKCYLITNKHLNNINTLKTFEDIINYEYNNYPDKINFV